MLFSFDTLQSCVVHVFFDATVRKHGKLSNGCILISTVIFVLTNAGVRRPEQLYYRN